VDPRCYARCWKCCAHDPLAGGRSRHKSQTPPAKRVA
jgi:hypothetical protein